MHNRLTRHFAIHQAALEGKLSAQYHRGASSNQYPVGSEEWEVWNQNFNDVLLEQEAWARQGVRDDMERGVPLHEIEARQESKELFQRFYRGGKS